MSRKSQLLPYNLVSAGDMSGSITSTVTIIQYIDNIGLQLSWTGTPTGAFFVEVSVDQVTWNSITFSTAPVAAGVAGSIYIDMNQLSAPYIRIRYVPTSGTGTLTAYITGKMV